MHAYDSNDLQRLFGLSAVVVRSLVRAGHLNPIRRAGRLQYSFQDLIVLRAASALRAANIPVQRINRTLRKLRAELPDGETLKRLSLMPLGDRIAVRQGRMVWESDSGQYVFALEIDSHAAALHAIRTAKAAGVAPASAHSAHALYAKACDLEDQDPAAARLAYEASLAADSQHLESRINLGRLLHAAGLLEEAERVYRGAVRPDALICFNLAVLLEDMNRRSEAILSYRDCLARDPQLADAHFNLARLFEQASDGRSSLRHLLAYRRMTVCS